MKINFNLILIAIFVVFLAACEDDNKNIYDGPSLAHFAESTTKIFVAETDNHEDNVVNVRVGVTQPASQDRSISLEFEGTAVKGEHYTVEAESVVIPAGEYFAELPVTFFFDAFADEELRVELNVAGGDIETADFNNSFIIRAERYCETMLDMFVGTYEVQDVSQYNGEEEPYRVTVSHNPEDGKMLTVNNLWEVPVNLNFTIDEPSFSNFVVELPNQPIFDHPDFGQAQIRHISPGTYNPCTFQIEISYEIYVDAGFFDRVVTSVWTKVD